MHSLLRHLRVLWRVESVITEMRLRLMLRRSAFYALAALIAAFGIGMLNVAAYFALVPLWGSLWAALAAALGDFVLALLVVVIAAVSRPGAEMNTALELRQAAIDGIEADLMPLQQRLGWLGRASRDPVEAVLPAILVPVVTAIMRGLRKKKSSSEAAAD